jgi:hypothetical protein
MKKIRNFCLKTNQYYVSHHAKIIFIGRKSTLHLNWCGVYERSGIHNNNPTDVTFSLLDTEPYQVASMSATAVWGVGEASIRFKILPFQSLFGQRCMIGC